MYTITQAPFVQAPMYFSNISPTFVNIFIASCRLLPASTCQLACIARCPHKCSTFPTPCLHTPLPPFALRCLSDCTLPFSFHVHTKKLRAFYQYN